jgi:hypothetical protein
MVPICKLPGAGWWVLGTDEKSGTWRLSTSTTNLGSQNMLLLNGVASLVVVSGRVGKVLTFRNWQFYHSGALYVRMDIGSNTQRIASRLDFTAEQVTCRRFVVWLIRDCRE